MLESFKKGKGLKGLVNNSEFILRVGDLKTTADITPLFVQLQCYSATCAADK